MGQTKDSTTRAPRDYRDLVIEELAYSEAALRARAESLEVDTATYQNLFKQTLEALATVTADRDRLRQRVREHAERVRALRQSIGQERAA